MNGINADILRPNVRLQYEVVAVATDSLAKSAQAAAWISISTIWRLLIIRRLYSTSILINIIKQLELYVAGDAEIQIRHCEMPTFISAAGALCLRGRGWLHVAILSETNCRNNEKRHADQQD